MRSNNLAPVQQMVEHHIKYNEIHGVDETIWLTHGEHERLHRKLRENGKCNISVDDLTKISIAAHERTPKRIAQKKRYKSENIQRIQFDEYVEQHVYHREQISVNLKTGSVGVSCYFGVNCGLKLKRVDIS